VVAVTPRGLCDDIRLERVSGHGAKPENRVVSELPHSPACRQGSHWVREVKFWLDRPGAAEVAAECDPAGLVV
jgi:hypothetical protein